ncbi:MAG TPA: LacI family DNA-binding transcriptional regulator [Acetobacteraceae bacterium]|jgi:LacI family gluconate utilization system Gnt-I transcriptional repressor|nr:LacI family DNA-binding transcriptional regulator [Acetobacteraceae bacterium]
MTRERIEGYACGIIVTTEGMIMSLQPRPPVKLSDVAAAAGVAPMTVSRVLNSPERVSAATAQLVRAAIERLGYVPNLVAGGLSSRRTRMVAAIVPTMAHPMFAELVQNFTDALRARGYEVMLSLSGYGEVSEAALVRAVLARRPDALLLTGATHDAPTRQMLADAAIPVVEVFDVARQPIDMLVGVDHAAAGAAVAAYFRSKGHKRFAVFGASDARARVRAAAFAEAARRGGGSVLAETVIPAPSTIGAGRTALRALLPALSPSAARGQRTALFCSSDLVAFGALVEAGANGVAVPDRLAVCGFGDFELSAASDPPFTTVSVEGERIGRHAAMFVLDRLGGAVGARRVQVPFRIIERASS